MAIILPRRFKTLLNRPPVTSPLPDRTGRPRRSGVRALRKGLDHLDHQPGVRRVDLSAQLQSSDTCVARPTDASRPRAGDERTQLQAHAEPRRASNLSSRPAATGFERPRSLRSFRLPNPTALTQRVEHDSVSTLELYSVSANMSGYSDTRVRIARRYPGGVGGTLAR